MPETSTQRALIDNLREALREHDGAQFVNVLETHISFVLLTGPYAYKVKKAVKFDFLDFSTLALRRFYCQEELRLNRRCAPQLYLEVLAIKGSAETPVIEGAGPAIEYAVKMIEFPQENLADRLLARGELRKEHIDALAIKLAVLHRSCGRAAPDSPHGVPKLILQQAREALSGTRKLLGEPADLADLDKLEKWTEQEFAARSNIFAKRKFDGLVRECHGDLHLGNVALANGEILLFDCIEFSEDLRWIDVMSDVAFLFMDLLARERVDFGYRFINSYLEVTGDYEGLSVLRFYVVYRAMVRAEITLLGMSQCMDGEKTKLAKIARDYLNLAKRWAQPMQPASAALILMHGLSGSGKTTVSQDILQTIGAIRLRSDV
ncbi:MAG: AAA family ATPase, partial [Burkholderiales bacterium]